MKIKIKKLHPKAAVPTQGKEGDACWDLTSVGITESAYDNGTLLYVEHDTGIAMQIPEDHVGIVTPRSSVTSKGLIMKNSIGIIDPGYRGSIKVRFWKTHVGPLTYKEGDRIAQLMIIPRPFLEFEVVNDLSDTIRGVGGYGSTGN